MVVGTEGGADHVVPADFGVSKIRSVMSIDGSQAIVDVQAPSDCGCDIQTRRYELTDVYLVDLATGKTHRLPTTYGKVGAAYLTGDGGMVLRVAPGGSGKPGKVIFLDAAGKVTATFDESTLAKSGVPDSVGKLSLVGYVPQAP